MSRLLLFSVVLGMLRLTHELNPNPFPAMNPGQGIPPYYGRSPFFPPPPPPPQPNYSNFIPGLVSLIAYYLGTQAPLQQAPVAAPAVSPSVQVTTGNFAPNINNGPVPGVQAAALSINQLSGNGIPVKTTNDAGTQAGLRVVGYYQNYKGVNVQDVDGSKLTHFVYTFMKVNNNTWNVEDGDKSLDVDKSFGSDDQCSNCAKGNYYQVYKLRQKYSHLRTIMSIGGWVNSQHFSTMFQTAELRTKFVQQTTKVMIDYGFDGIDIDWEFPVTGGIGPRSPNDGVNLIAVLQEYRNQWKQFERNGRHFELTVAMPNNLQSYLQGSNLQQFSSLVDWIMIMAYEFQYGSKVTRHGANLYANPQEPPENHRLTVDAGVMSYINNGQGFPPAQILVGIPCYARGFKNVQATSQTGLYSPYSGDPSDLLEYRNLSSLASRGFTEYYDDAAQSTYYFSPSEKMFYTVESPKSVEALVNYVKQKNLGGFMIWDITTDLPPSDPKSLLNTISRTIGKMYKDPRPDDCKFGESFSHFANIGCKGGKNMGATASSNSNNNPVNTGPPPNNYVSGINSHNNLYAEAVKSTSSATSLNFQTHPITWISIIALLLWRY